MSRFRLLLPAPFPWASFLFALALLHASCSSPRKTAGTTTNPATTVAPPGPAMHRLVPDSLQALPVSEIDIPVKVYARPLLAQIEDKVPKEFTSVGWPNYIQSSCDFRYKYRFVRSGLQVTCTNNKFGVQLTGNYQIAGSRSICAAGQSISPWISGNCGFGSEPMRRVHIGIGSQLNFLPGYRIRTETRLEQLQALDKCTVSIFSSDVTQQILDSVRASVTSFCASFDQAVGGMDFSGFVKKTADASFGKMSMAQYGWLSVNPTAIRLGRLNYAKDTLALSVGLSCRPLLTSDSSRPANASNLPPLQTVDNRDGLSLYLNAAYDYNFLTKMMLDSLRDKVFTVQGRTIVCKDVAIRGIANHQIEIRIDFAGSNSGRIFLRGTPVLDVDKQTLTIPDISYSLESGDLVLKMARVLFKNKIRKTLEGNSYLDIAALIKTNQPMLDAQLNRKITPDTFTTGKTKEIRLIGLLSQERGLQVQIFVSANLSITSLGLPR